MTTIFKNNLLKHTLFFLVTNLFIIQFLSENGFRNYFDIDLWHYISFVTFNDFKFTEPTLYNVLKQSPAFTVQIFEFIQKYIPNLLDKDILYLQYLIIFITIYSIIYSLYNFTSLFQSREIFLVALVITFIGLFRIYSFSGNISVMALSIFILSVSFSFVNKFILGLLFTLICGVFHPVYFGLSLSLLIIFFLNQHFKNYQLFFKNFTIKKANFFKIILILLCITYIIHIIISAFLAINDTSVKTEILYDYIIHRTTNSMPLREGLGLIISNLILSLSIILLIQNQNNILKIKIYLLLSFIIFCLIFSIFTTEIVQTKLSLALALWFRLRVLFMLLFVIALASKIVTQRNIKNIVILAIIIIFLFVPGLFIIGNNHSLFVYFGVFYFVLGTLTLYLCSDEGLKIFNCKLTTLLKLLLFLLFFVCLINTILLEQKNIEIKSNIHNFYSCLILISIVVISHVIRKFLYKISYNPNINIYLFVCLFFFSIYGSFNGIVKLASIFESKPELPNYVQFVVDNTSPKQVVYTQYHKLYGKRQNYANWKDSLYIAYSPSYLSVFLNRIKAQEVNLSLKESNAYRRCKNAQFLFLYGCYKYFGLVHKQLAYYYQNDRMLDMNKAVPNLVALLSIRDLKRFNQKNIIAKNNKYFLVYLSNK